MQGRPRSLRATGQAGGARATRAADPVDVGDVRALHLARGVASRSCAAAASPSTRRTCTRASRRVHRGGLGGNAHRARRRRRRARATRSAASSSARPTGRFRRRCPRRWRPGCGRSSAWARRRRSASAERPSASLRHQVQEGLEKVPAARLAEVVVAYEPIWAIGTGRMATPERGPGGDRLRPRARRRSLARGRAARPGAVRRQRETGQRGRDPGAARRGRRAGRRREPGPRGFRTDRGRGGTVSVGQPRPAPAQPPVPNVCLIVLDGWGLAEPGPGNAVEQAETPVFDELWGLLPAHHAHRLGRGRRAARGADGEL